MGTAGLDERHVVQRHSVTRRHGLNTWRGDVVRAKAEWWTEQAASKQLWRTDMAPEDFSKKIQKASRLHGQLN